jgi:hypothetical protein
MLTENKQEISDPMDINFQTLDRRSDMNIVMYATYYMYIVCI